jgi:capsular exopolysaccharide synthesis family protein
MSASDVWRVLRANVWLILIVLILSTALGYGLNLWLSAKHSLFRSTGLIQVTMNKDLLPVEVGRQLSVSTAELEYEKGTQVKLLLHERLLSELLEGSDALRATTWFQQFISSRPTGEKVVDAEAAKADLLDRLKVRSEPDSRLISVQVEWSIPRDCQTIVEEIVNLRIKEQKAADDNNTLDRTAAIQALKLNYESQIHDANRLMQTLATELGGMGVQVAQGASSKDYELQQLLSEELKARAFYGAAVAKLATFKNQLETNSAPELEEALQKNGRYNDYRQQAEVLDANYQDLAGNLGPQNPRAASMKRRLDEMQKKLFNTEEEIKARTATLILANLENDSRAAESAIQRIDKREGEVRQEIAAVATKRNDYATLQAQVLDLRGKIDKLKDQQERITASGTSTKSGLIDWATFPELPDHPIFPKWYIIIPLTAMLGLALSVGLAFLREMTDTTIRTPRDIARVGQLTLLGMIPHEDDDPEAAGARLPLAIFEAPHSIIAEQFRHVRTRLHHAAALDTTRSILITGCSAEDGKTTVAVNLAAGLALNGRRILLVDANFRRPDLHNVFNCGNDVGFGDVLNDLDMFQDVVSDTEVPNLALITTGTRPSNPTELLESQLLIDFIERALEEYDHVIFDSGPLLMVSDTIALAPRVDGVVTVVRATGNSRGMLGRMRDELRRLKAEHLGVVLNAVRVHGGGYYGAMIKNYYGYQNG